MDFPKNLQAISITSALFASGTSPIMDISAKPSGTFSFAKASYTMMFSTGLY